MVIGNSCKKYENGPAVTFRSPSTRIERKWNLDKLLKGGEEVTLTAQQKEEEWTFQKDQTFLYQASINSSLVTKGSWSFTDDKNSVILTPDGGPVSTKWDIIKLTTGEFWFNVTINNEPCEYHLFAL